MRKTTRLKKPQIPELDTLYRFDDLGGRPKYGGVEMTSETDIPSFQEIMDETHSAVVAEATARDDADEALQAQIDSLSGNLSSETEDRIAADNNLQSEIDTIVAASDVKDLVGTYADLQAYDTSTLGDNDIIKVLQDETHQNEMTYYRWILADEQFSLIGEEGPYYTKAATDALLDDKADKADTYTKTEVDALVPPVVQTTGTSTTDVMSQNAATSMVFADPGTNQKIQIGSDSNAAGIEATTVGYHSYANNWGTAIGTYSRAGGESIGIGRGAIASGVYSIAIGSGARVENVSNSVAIGAAARATRRGEVNVGTGSETWGYNKTRYCVIGGVHDPVDAHDAATKNYVDGLVGNIAAALNAINNGGGN